MRETWRGARSLRLPGGAELIRRSNARGASLPRLRLTNGAELDVLADVGDLDVLADGAELDVMSRPLAVDLTATCDEPYRSAAGVPLTARLRAIRRPTGLPRFARPSRGTIIGIAFATLIHAALFVLTFCKPALAADEDFIEKREPIATIRFLSLDFPEPVICFPEFEPIVRINDERATLWGSPRHHGRMGATSGNLPAEEQVGCRRAPHVHVVLEGETLTSIALLYGFDSFRDLYRQDVNPWLVEERPNPNLIFPGDRVVIPDEDPDALCLVEP
jgi:hypothetical protein